jgi:hypothetical protein
MTRTSIRIAYAARVLVADATTVTRIADIGRIWLLDGPFLLSFAIARLLHGTELSL